MPPGLDYRHCAVGADEAPQTLYIPREIPTARGLVTPSLTNKFSSLMRRDVDDIVEEAVTCDGTTVDAILAANPGPGNVALWLDVEGAVQQVLAGAGQALSDGRVGLIYTELETKTKWRGQWLAPDVHAFLMSHSYVPLARDLETKPQYNQIYAHRSVLSTGVLRRMGAYMAQILNRHFGDPDAAA
jgi:hypothetical protein